MSFNSREFVLHAYSIRTKVSHLFISMITLLLVLFFSLLPYSAHAEEVSEKSEKDPTEQIEVNLLIGTGMNYTYTWEEGSRTGYDYSKNIPPTFLGLLENLSAEFSVYYPFHRYYTLGAGIQIQFIIPYLMITNRLRFPSVSDGLTLYVELPIGMGLIGKPDYHDSLGFLTELRLTTQLRVGFHYKGDNGYGFHMNAGPDFLFSKTNASYAHPHVAFRIAFGMVFGF